MTRRSRLAARPRLERLDDRCVLSAITPAQLDAAYGLSAITFSNGTVKGTGEGQTIAIVDAYNDPTIYSDLTAFDTKYGIPNPTLSSLPAANSATSKATPSFTAVDLSAPNNSSWNTEEALDVEMAHAAAPGANIVLIEAKSASLTDLLNAVKTAETISSVSVISMSWGSAEFAGEKADDSIFTTPAGHTGITFVASAGDTPGTEWPAVSPNVVGVGGTSLVVSSTGAIVSQTAWSSSGGGTSQFESKPSYQSALPGNARSSPDVALDADPNTGVVIFSQGQQVQVGGTSLSAPVFGGLIAIADQGLATAGKTPLASTQTLTDLYSAKAGSFTPVASTTTTTQTGHGHTTTSIPTGLGSPFAPTLVSSLTGLTTTTTTTTGTGGGTTTTGGGTTTTGGGGTTTTGGGGTTTTGGGGTTTTGGGSNQGRGRWGFFGSGFNWWDEFFYGGRF
jgi:subtilase family serine protease